MGPAGAARGTRPDASPAAARHDPLPSDGAVPAPKRREPLSAASFQRDRILCLCAHGGLTGVPQVSIPGADVDGLPVGLSIVGGPGTDGTLVAVALAIG